MTRPEWLPPQLPLPPSGARGRRHVDYVLARRSVLRDLRSGRLERSEVCDAHPELIRAGRVDGATSVRLLTHIEAPLAWPAVLAGVRNGFTLAVTGAVVGEMVMGGQGLGMVLTVQRDAVDTAGMFATIAVLCLVAAAIYSLIYAWERGSRLTDATTA